MQRDDAEIQREVASSGEEEPAERGGT